MLTDLRLALRQFARTPGLVVVIVVSLALGIGANATVLCWLRNLVLRPLPGVADQQQLVVLVSNQGGGNVSLPDLRDFAAEDRIFAGALATMPTHASLTVGRQSAWLEAQIVTANFFDLLGVQPLLGRGFQPGEDQKPGGNPVLVISERLWRRQFDSDPEIIGREVELNRHRFTVVGVMPADFNGTVPPNVFDVWAPASMIWEVRNQGTFFLDRRGARGWLNLARLQPGVTVAQADAAVRARNAQLSREQPRTNRDTHHRVVPLSQCPWGVQTIMAPVLALLLAVSLGVLLIVAANVANLLLARAVRRQKEVAIRVAAGASRAQLVRQFLIESVVLAAAGGAAGLLAASWMIDSIPFLFGVLPTLDLEFQLDAPTLALTAALTLATGLVFGLVPALQASRANLGEALKAGGRSSTGSATHHRLRAGLVVAEVALALVLLVGAGLCLAGLERARRIDFGLDPSGVLAADLQIGMNGYTRETGPVYYRRLRERLAGLPGVREAALASWLPLGLTGCKGTNVDVDGYARPAGEDATVEYAIVSPRYFAALGIPLLAGRDFTDADDATVPETAVVNETFARRYWPGRDPLGRQFRASGRVRTVVGVVPTGKYNRLDETPRPFLYLPYQQGVPDLDLGIVVKTAGDPQVFAATVRQAVRDLDPQVELLGTLPLQEHTQKVLTPQRVGAMLLVLLGLVALILAAMGVYAVMAYAVGERTQEFGVRMALGASPGDVLRLVLRRGLALSLGGVAAGLVLALGLSRLLGAFLFGVSPFDPLTYAAVAGLLILVALAACVVPARRATRVSPNEALRAE